MGLRARSCAPESALVGQALLGQALLGLGLFGLMGVLPGCSGQMADQASYRTGEIALMPASGSIPMAPRRPWAYKLAPGTATASNPVRVTEAVLAEGQELYGNYCVFCHGVEGRGDGPVGEVYAPRPANLHLPRLVSATDGHVYEVITNGYSTMPAFYKRLSPEERWRIVAYVRELQRGRD